MPSATGRPCTIALSGSSNGIAMGILTGVTCCSGVHGMCACRHPVLKLGGWAIAQHSRHHPPPPAARGLSGRNAATTMILNCVLVYCCVAVV